LREHKGSYELTRDRLGELLHWNRARELMRWLDPNISREHAISLLQPYPAELMRSAAASTLVNSVKNEGPELLAA
jgi:putative SOS response-associated peptidase YedK